MSCQIDYVDSIITRYLKKREDTKKMINERDVARIFKNVNITRRDEARIYPCFLWKGKKQPKVTIKSERCSPSRFLYDYCVGEIKDGDRLSQECDKKATCIQPFHQRIFCRKIFKENPYDMRESTLAISERTGVSFPDKADMEALDDSAIVDSGGNIFMTLEMFQRISKVDPFDSYQEENSEISNKIPDES